MENFLFKNVKQIQATNGKWHIEYYIRYPTDIKFNRKREFGKTFQISIDKDESRLERLEKLVQRALENGTDPEKFETSVVKEYNQIFDKKISIDDSIEIMIKQKGWENPDELQSTSATNIPNFLRNEFKPYLIKIGKNKDVRQVKKMDIWNFIDENFNRVGELEQVGRGKKKKGGWMASTANHNLTLIGMMFKVLVGLDLMEANPAIHVERRKDSQKHIKIDEEDENDFDAFEPWTDSETSIWFDILNQSTHHSDLVLLATSQLIYSGFVRKTECLRLKVSSIDWDRKQLVIPAKDTKSARKYDKNDIVRVNVNNVLLKTLRRYIDLRFPNGFDQSDYLIFLKDPQKKYNYRTLITQFDAKTELLQKEHPNMFNSGQYALKHTGTIKLYYALNRAGKKPAETQFIVQNHCRHSDWGTTANYLRRKCRIDLDDRVDMIDF